MISNDKKLYCKRVKRGKDLGLFFTQVLDLVNMLQSVLQRETVYSWNNKENIFRNRQG